MQKRRDSAHEELFQETCRKHRLRITPQRAIIYNELIRSHEHPTAERLHSMVNRHFPHISLDTVNRTLLKFAEIGLIQVVEGFGSPRRYDANMEKHHHLHCVKCGVIIDFSNKEFDDLRVPDGIGKGFSILGKRVILSGICRKCSRRK